MSTSRIKIAPSILAADFGRLAEEVVAVERSGADYIHVDVMDGCFVPQITIGQPVVEAVKACSNTPLDVHLMIVDPDRYLESFVEAGAAVLTVHLEACTHLHRTLATIRSLGARAGVALNPATSFEQLRWVIEEVDLVLVMSVNPGFGGQKFIDSALRKVDALRALCAQHGVFPEIEVDGGVSAKNAEAFGRVGVDVLVAGTAIFRAADYAQAIDEIRAKAQLGRTLVDQGVEVV
ncbi:MAG: ribulose-phosphate 3-epimerase [Deltaproteobacteria bacterium]|nr:ribulose-phosphate 3-epimerase [Deltaproteobacteria bacterium]